MRSIKFLKVYFWFTLIISIILLVFSFKTTLFYHFFSFHDLYRPNKDIMKVVIDHSLTLPIIFDLLITVALPIILIWIPYLIIAIIDSRRSRLA